MDYLIAALAVFFLIRLTQNWVDGPEWFFGSVIPGVLSGAFVALSWTPMSWEWWSFLAIAGIVILLQRLDSWIMIMTDQALLNITRRR